MEPIEPIEPIGSIEPMVLAPLKIIPLKFIFSSELKQDDPIELIPDEIIHYDDNRPYHYIQMYKKLLAFHIGLTTRFTKILESNLNNIKYRKTISEEGIITGSFPKENEIKNYLKCGKKEKIIFPIKEDIIFQHILINESFSLHFGYDINVVCKGLTLFIVFPSAYPENNINISNNYTSKFFEFLRKLVHVIPRITQIVCCGHSAGMRHATSCAFLLSCVKNPRFLAMNISLFANVNHFNNIEHLTSILTDKKIYIVGSGGSPEILNKEQFRLFYDELKGRYVSIYSGLKTPERFYIDYVAGTNINKSIKSFKFGVYYTSSKTITDKYNLDTCTKDVLFISSGDDEVQSEISTFCTNKEESSDITSYIGNMFFEDYEVPPFIPDENTLCKRIFRSLHKFYIYRNLLSIFVFDTKPSDTESVVSASAASAGLGSRPRSNKKLKKINKRPSKRIIKKSRKRITRKK